MMYAKIKKYGLLGCLMVGMSFTLVYNLLYAIRPDQSPAVVLLSSICFLLLVMMFGTNKTTCIISTLACVIGGGLISFYLYGQGDLFTVYRRIFFFVRRNEFILGISLLVSIIVYFFTIKRNRWFIPVGVGGICCSLYIIQKLPLPTGGVESFIFMSLCYYFYSYYEKTDLQAKQYVKSIGVFIILVLGLTCVSAYIAPIQFSFLHSVLDQKTYNMQTYRYSEYYPYTGRLGGNLTLNDREILDVMASKHTYLRGGTKSVYTGYGWENHQEEVRAFSLGYQELKDTQEALLGSQLLMASVEELFERESYRIRYKDVRTRSLFIPSKMQNLAVSRNHYSIYCENEDTFLLDDPQDKGFVYVVQSYIPRYKSSIFEDAMKRSKPGLYKEAKQMGIDPFNGELDFFIERADEIRMQYTQLPSSVTDRVKELAEKITEGYETPYEKVRAIEAYLAGNYTYTLTPGEPRRNQDFVDQFLFENQEGYCTYFATAMAVLTRSIGIPSRYVEGYVMPSEPTEGEQYYRVTSKQAHAWVEVYFEGIGWLMFEPTASYQNDLRGYTDVEQDTYYRQSVMDQEIQQNSLKQPAKGIVAINKNLYILGIGILITFAILGCLGVCIYQHQYRKRMSCNEAICYFYNLGLKQLYRKGYVMVSGETEMMYAKRMDQQLGEDFLTLTKYTRVYLKARYSLIELSVKEVEMMKQFYKQCRKKSKFREKQN